MRRFEFKEQDHEPIWLHHEEIENPEKVFEEFFASNTLPDCRFYIWEMLTAAISESEPAVHPKFPVTKMVKFSTQLFCVLEALALVNRENLSVCKYSYKLTADQHEHIPHWVLNGSA